jgi:GAF domain-containing protein
VTALLRVLTYVKPIPETLEALAEVDSFLDEESLEQQLRTTAARAEQLAPGLLGVSLAFREHGLTFTLIATDEDIATLDAVQYIASGPCVDAIDLGHGIATPDGLLSEHRWQHFARASAAAGVKSTLTLPVVDGEVVVSTVNLYGREDDTFTGKHQVLAGVFGAWAPGAVANADLTFATRREAQQAPTQLREAALVDTATGILASEREVTVDVARAQLVDAARRAGVPVHRLARVMVDLYLDE